MVIWRQQVLEVGMLMNNCNCKVRENIPSWRLFSPLCVLDGCPGLCYGNGRCTLDQNGWHCVCQVGWSGSGCNVVMEMVCADNLDNDGGMIHNSCVSVYLSHPCLPFKSIVLVCAFLFIPKCQCLPVCSRHCSTLFIWSSPVREQPLVLGAAGGRECLWPDLPSQDLLFAHKKQNKSVICNFMYLLSTLPHNPVSRAEKQPRDTQMKKPLCLSKCIQLLFYYF